MTKDINQIKNATKSASGGMYSGGGGPLDDAAV